jgi:hypothetical protein
VKSLCLKSLCPGHPHSTWDEILLEPAARDGQISQETLYLEIMLEIRRPGRTLDPADWFDATGSEAIR